jgi:SUMO ligase MMS21 Smc5/6 complex component
VDESFTCPLTTKIVEDPVKCITCKHYYEKQAILGVLKKNVHGITCPTIGCSVLVTKQSLIDAPEVLRALVRQNKRKRKEEEEGGSADDGFTQLD